MNCHLDRSVAEWRDLRFLFFESGEASVAGRLTFVSMWMTPQLLVNTLVQQDAYSRLGR
jgi:hypothetical protein